MEKTKLQEKSGEQNIVSTDTNFRGDFTVNLCLAQKCKGN